VRCERKTAGLVYAAVALLMTQCGSLPADGRRGELSMVHCGGVNACKGQSACKSAANACKARNNCKGQGWLRLSEQACSEKGGTAL